MDGHGLTYSSCIIRSVAERCMPKLIVWEVSFQEEGSWNEKVNTLKPYYFTNKFVKEVMLQVNPTSESYKCRVASYRFNSLLPRFANAYLSDTRDSLSGYTPLRDNGKGHTLKSKRDTSVYVPVDPCTEAVFRQTVAYLEKRGIPLVVVISPELRHHIGNASLATVCQSMHIPFFDNSSAAECTGHPEFFNDPTHMNRIGSQKYTHYFLSQLRKSKVLMNSGSTR